MRPTPLASPDGTGFRDISFGHKHAAFVTGSGDLYTYGVGPALGHGEGVEKVETPLRVEGLPPVVSVQCGQQHTIALTETGEVYSFGKGGSFLSFLGTPSALGVDGGDAVRPVRVNVAGQRIVQIASGSAHVMARTADGQLYGWGSGASGRLGNGSSSSERTPVLLDALADKRVTSISCGSSFNGALTDDGGVWMWGRNEKGQLGTGVSLTLDQYSMENAPARVEFDEETEDGKKVVITHLSCAYKHTLAISDAGHIYTWGQSKWLKPNLMKGDDGWMMKETFTDCSGGQGFSAAVLADGSLVTWGEGSTSCLGHGTRSSLKDPLQVRGFGATPKLAGANADHPWMGKIVKVLAGHNHCAVLTSKQ